MMVLRFGILLVAASPSIAIQLPTKLAQPRLEVERAGFDRDHGALVVGIAACSCNMLDVECLPTAACMEQFLSTSRSRVAGGVTLRRLMKQDISWDPKTDDLGHGMELRFPLGKGLQYSAMESWKNWAKGNPLNWHWADLGGGFTAQYPDSSKYPYCREHNLTGSSCTWGAWNETEDLGDLEKESLLADAETENLGGLEKESLLADGGEAEKVTFEGLNAFRQIATSSVLLQEATKQGRTRIADEFLLSFAHLLRIEFHREQSMQSLYKELLTSIGPGKDGKTPLKVGLHIRRGDSCAGGTDSQPSRMDAPAMTTPQRKCYEASVYADALNRIYEKYKTPLEIYLSTDSNSEVLDELRESSNSTKASLIELKSSSAAARLRTATDMQYKTMDAVVQVLESKYPHVHETSTWRILNYSRASFAYDGAIDFVSQSDKTFLTEAAIQDLWHLSHAEVFVGHLSSRFGKVGYLLAVARQNSPIAYVTPDGHNLCCEVDEVCSAAVGQMDSMADCLLFAHENFPGCDNGNYWTSGCNNRQHVTW